MTSLRALAPLEGAFRADFRVLLEDSDAVLDNFTLHT
jgi:hypothetical protein